VISSGGQGVPQDLAAVVNENESVSSLFPSVLHALFLL